MLVNQLQNCPLRLITGQLKSASLEALGLEAEVQSYHTCSNRLILKAREKALHWTNDHHPKRVALAADIPQRLQNCCSFCCMSNDLYTLLSSELQHWQNINHFPSPPWQLHTPCEEQIATTVSGITGQADSIDLKRWCSVTIIASYQANYNIYTNGSASRGTRWGHSSSCH